MDEGVALSDNPIKVGNMKKNYPDFLILNKTIVLTENCKVNPAKLEPNCAYIYGLNLYMTDVKGTIAFIDCDLTLTENPAAIKAKHPVYKQVGGKKAVKAGMDAGHFGVQLGQHPSIAVEQDPYMNRYGMWRKFEISWAKLLREGHSVNVKAVFTDGEEGTYSDFWCVRETIDDDEINEFVLTNDDGQ